MRLSQTSSQDASTQTNSVSSPTRIGRSFSILRHRRSNKPLDDEILELIECCRRYQVSNFLENLALFFKCCFKKSILFNLLRGTHTNLISIKRH